MPGTGGHIGRRREAERDNESDVGNSAGLPQGSGRGLAHPDRVGRRRRRHRGLGLILRAAGELGAGTGDLVLAERVG
ncbi:MAG TPA: hypothetical protein VLH10_26290 [Yinghuangia sp.]|uniref:hypothetical protein n=1 Tax=Yinghuangia sp. YIM S10712 TaxID=3436930 RepID=UPI002CA6EEC5|nr:hypothetical protein [Yinghuangia sp.]